MSHKTTTYTVVCAFAPRDERVHESFSHTLAVHGVAYWASQWWKEEAKNDSAYDNVGFTCARSWGGGAGWPVEHGVTVVLAGLTPDHAPGVRRFAAALKALEHQEAVVVLSRLELFDLV